MPSAWYQLDTCSKLLISVTSSMQVENMEVVERFLNETKYHEVKHPVGTVMRMADEVLPFKLRFEPEVK